MTTQREKRSHENDHGEIIEVRTIVIIDMELDETPYAHQVGLVVDTEYTWSPSDGPIAVRFIPEVRKWCLKQSGMGWPVRPHDPFERIYLNKRNFVCFYPHELRRYPSPWQISQALIERALSQN